jgi:hypothetical protein
MEKKRVKLWCAGRANSLVVDTLDFNIYAVTESSSGVTINQETTE